MNHPLYFAIYKPFNFLSQFTKEKEGDQCLGDLYNFPKDVYPVGGLDKDSEGLLILTNDPSLNSHLLNPKNKLSKTYWVQVESEINNKAIELLSSGIDIKVDKIKYRTLPAECEKLISSIEIPDRNPPIRHRTNISTSWIQLSINEGKNRQIRKMCATVGFPVLRLIRIGIGKYKFNQLIIGEVRKITKSQIF